MLASLTAVSAQYYYAPAVCRAFVAAASASAGAVVANFPGVRATLPDVVAAIEAAAPEAAGRITWDESALPFPAQLEAHALDRAIWPVQQPTLAEGVAETIARFRQHAGA